jgi:hypothetical protein
MSERSPRSSATGDLWGRLLICGRLAIGLPEPVSVLEERRLPIAAQDAILPHNTNRAEPKSADMSC